MPIGFEEEGGIAYTPHGSRVNCLKCLRSFSTMHNAERHYRSQHMVSERAPCKFCHRQFKNKYSLHEHLRTHHGLTQSMLRSARVVPKLNLVEEPDQKLSFQQLDWSKRPME